MRLDADKHKKEQLERKRLLKERKENEPLEQEDQDDDNSEGTE